MRTERLKAPLLSTLLMVLLITIAVLSVAAYPSTEEPPYPLLPETHPLVRQGPFFVFSTPSLIVEPPAQPIIIGTETAHTVDEYLREPYPIPFGLGGFPVVAAAAEVESGRVIVYGPGASFRSSPIDHFSSFFFRMKELGLRMIGWLARWENAAQHKVLFYWTTGAFHDAERCSLWIDYLRALGYTVDNYTDGITAERLAPYSVLMLITPERAFTSAEIIAIRDWVHAGGGLFIGEQADYGGSSKPFYTNPILDALGANITVQDDQVIDNVSWALDGPWAPQVYLVDHPVWYPPYAVSAKMQRTILWVYDGREGVFTLTVSNDGTEADNYKIEVISTKGWPVELEREEITLPSGQSDNIKISASAPEVDEHTRDDLTVKVTGTGLSAEQVFALMVAPLPVEVSISLDYTSGLPGENVTFTVTVKNEGTVSDTYSLTTADNAGWSSSISPTSLSVAAGENQTATLNVTIPSDAAEGDSTTITVTATSTGDPTINNSAPCTAVAEAAAKFPIVPVAVVVIIVVILGAVLVIKRIFM